MHDIVVGSIMILCQEGGVCRPAQSAEALAYLYPKSVKKWLSTMHLLITLVWSLTYQIIRSTPLRYWELQYSVSEIIKTYLLRGADCPPLLPATYPKVTTINLWVRFWFKIRFVSPKLVICMEQGP
jgi:hypothetical protein